MSLETKTLKDNTVVTFKTHGNIYEQISAYEYV